MSTPFDSKPQAMSERLATGPQLVRAIKPMLDDRKWQDAPESYATRCAAIKTVLAIVTDEDMTSRMTQVGVSVTGDVAVDFAAVMAKCAASAEPGKENVWKPLTVKGASALIDWLGSQQWAGPTSLVEESNVAKAKAAARSSRGTGDLPSAEAVPAGRYAVETEDGATNELAFYKVDRPTEGRWAGYVFVKLLVSDSEQRMSFPASKAILRKIAEVGAEAASARYGHEIGKCGICGRTLTNDESRERGIGPVCADKMGW